MKADRKKLKLAMARACMSNADLLATTGLPGPTVKNVLAGKGVRPTSLGHVAKALGVDPVEIIGEV